MFGRPKSATALVLGFFIVGINAIWSFDLLICPYADNCDTCTPVGNGKCKKVLGNSNCHKLGKPFDQPYKAFGVEWLQHDFDEASFYEDTPGTLYGNCDLQMFDNDYCLEPASFEVVNITQKDRWLNCHTDVPNVKSALVRCDRKFSDPEVCENLFCAAAPGRLFPDDTEPGSEPQMPFGRPKRPKPTGI